MGELASAPILAAAIRGAGILAKDYDARDLIRTDESFGEATVDFEETRSLTMPVLADVPAGVVSVVTGFVASTEDGATTTLGRSGSDYTATILAGVLSADRVDIWTDVDGVLSADPRLVREAYSLPELSYQEAAEMAYFGAKVLHPRTMKPLLAGGIALHIRNTMNPSARGTRIAETGAPSEGSVKALTAVRKVSVVMIEGAGMIGVPGISAQAFTALAAAGVNVLMISQASSEQSICVVVRASDSARGVQALSRAFERELACQDVSRIYAIGDCAVVSAVGDQMRQRPGLAGRMFSTFGHCSINVLAIAQGASETNISAVVADPDVAPALNALHATFALRRQRAHVFLLGVGGVGRSLLDALRSRADHVDEMDRLRLRLIGAANSKSVVWDDRGMDPGAAAEGLASSSAPADLEEIVDRVIHSKLERRIFVDATASPEVGRMYPALLEAGVSVVTPNKHANSGDLNLFKSLHAISADTGVPYLYETTVGAALPVVDTLQDLLRSGDHVLHLRAVLSGTLSYVFNRLGEGENFSTIVEAARRLGYTEPDAREDIRGLDAARKLLILARMMSLNLEMSDVEVEPILPDDVLSGPEDGFMERLKSVDDVWRNRVADARSRSRSIRYVGEVAEGSVRLRITEEERESPFASLRGTENLVAFHTERYAGYPLVIRGPGAGPELTAAGVLNDVVKAATAFR
jgi:aspartokinase/homoserine dehydrogenase 1